MNKLVSIISFFVYSGYYAGLAIILALNLKNLSRFYSIPLRIVLTFIMFFIIHKNRENIFKNKNSKIIFLFIVFWVYYLLKVLYTENSNTTNFLSKDWYEYIFFSLTYVVLPFISFYSINYEKQKTRILNGLIFSGFILGIVSLYLYGDLLSKGVGRLNMITYETGEDVLNPLALSYSGSLTIVLCLYKLIILNENSKKEKLYLYLNIILSFIMFLLGSSRGSVIALALTLPLFVLYSPLKQKIKIIVLGILVSPVFIWSIKASGSSIFDRIGNTVEDDGGGRGSLWANAINHFLEHPIFGGNIEIGGIYPHNFIVEILMSTGIIGLILISPVVFQGIKLSIYWSNQKKEHLYILIMLIQGFTQYFFTAGFYTSSLLFVPIAIILSIKHTPKMNN